MPKSTEIPLATCKRIIGMHKPKDFQFGKNGTALILSALEIYIKRVSRDLLSLAQITGRSKPTARDVGFLNRFYLITSPTVTSHMKDATIDKLELPWATIRRMMKEFGVEICSKNAVNAIRWTCEYIVKHAVKNAARVMKSAGKKQMAKKWMEMGLSTVIWGVLYSSVTDD